MVPSRDLEGFSAGELIHLSDQMVTCTVFQREMMAATEKLYPLLGKSQGNTSWRNHTALFPSETESPSCHDTCHVPGLAPIFLFSSTITSPSFSPVCALEGSLFRDVISLTHICVPLLRPMTVILGLTHPSSLIYDMTSSSLTRCVLSCL